MTSSARQRETRERADLAAADARLMGKHAHGPPEAAPAEVDCADWCTTDNAMNLQCSGCAWNVPSEGDTTKWSSDV